MVYSEHISNIEQLLYPFITKDKKAGEKVEWKIIKYGCSPELFAFIKNLKDQKYIVTMSDLLDEALNFYFQAGPIILKNSTNFILHDMKDWSDEDYKLFLDHLLKMNEIFTKIIHKNLTSARNQ